jgi:hypothetical protein
MGLLKDSVDLALSTWRSINKRWLLSLFQSTVARARGWTVAEWHSPYSVVEVFGDRDLLKRRSEAWERRKNAWVEQQKLSPSFNADDPDGPFMTLEEPQGPKARERFLALDRMYEEANTDGEAFDGLLRAGIHIRLLSGELIARGFREPFTHGAPYLTISRHEWHIIRLEEGSTRAVGNGVAYVGVTIGKPGTRRFLRRRGRNPTAARNDGDLRHRWRRGAGPPVNLPS